MTKVTKQYTLGKAADGSMIASTPNFDRDNDRVLPLGIDLSNYRRNPILIFGHDYSTPSNVIGRAVDLKADAKGLTFRPQLRPAATEHDSQNVVRLLWDEGFLNAASIGFKPVRATKNERGGQDFHESELYEISLVPIPANQDAVREIVKSFGARRPSKPSAQPTVAEEKELARQLQDLVRFLRAELTRQGRIAVR